MASRKPTATGTGQWPIQSIRDHHEPAVESVARWTQEAER